MEQQILKNFPFLCELGWTFHMKILRIFYSRLSHRWLKYHDIRIHGLFCIHLPNTQNISIGNRVDQWNLNILSRTKPSFSVSCQLIHSERANFSPNSMQTIRARRKNFFLTVERRSSLRRNALNIYESSHHNKTNPIKWRLSKLMVLICGIFYVKIPPTIPHKRIGRLFQFLNFISPHPPP